MIKYKQMKSEKQNMWRSDAKRADKYISYCPQCKECWEKLEKKRWINKSSRWNVVFLHDFPRYGKKTKVCPKCIEESK